MSYIVSDNDVDALIKNIDKLNNTLINITYMSFGMMILAVIIICCDIHHYLVSHRQGYTAIRDTNERKPLISHA